MRRLVFLVTVGICVGLVAAPAIADPWMRWSSGQASLAPDGVVVPDAANSYGGGTTDVASTGGPSWARDALSVNSWAGTFSLEHESLPGGSQQCTSSSRVSFTDRDAADRRTWLESLATNGTGLGDATIWCYTGRNWGNDYEAFFVTFPGSDSDPSGQCVEISRTTDEAGVVTLTVSAPGYSPAVKPVMAGPLVVDPGSPESGCKATITQGYNEPGPGVETKILDEAASAPFQLSLTLDQ